MNSEKTIIIIVFCLFISVQFCPASDNADNNTAPYNSGLRLYLPRQVTVQDNLLKLGQVTIVRGNEDLVAKASEIGLGRIAFPAQKVVLDRATIVSRLACSGISSSEVTLSGAEQVIVQKHQLIITNDEFVDLAKAFFMQNPPVRSVCQLDAVRIPEDLVLPASIQDMNISHEFVNSTVRNQAKVKIHVVADGKKVGEREIPFRLRYSSHSIVTLKEIAAGEVISPDKVKIEESVSGQPESSNWKPPYGFVAKRRLAVNTVVRPDMIEPPTPAVVLKRNEMVLIRIERPGLLVTAIGKALEQGHIGEYIKVRNVDSQRTILCKVSHDGTVEPIL